MDARGLKNGKAGEVQFAVGPESSLPVCVVKNVGVHVGPEFLDEIGSAIEPNLHNPFLSGFGPCGIFAGIVEAGDSGSSTVADDFRKIESVVCVIGCGQVGASNEQSADRIHAALEDASATHGVVSRILVRSNGDDGFREQVAVHIIRKRVPVIAAVPGGAMTKLRIGFFCVGHASEAAHINK